MSREVWIYAEQEDAELAEISLELLGKGRELADRLGVKLGALLVGGEGVAELAKGLVAHGADKVYVAGHAKLSHYQSASYSKTVVEAIRANAPQICVFGATAIGRDLAPMVASTLRCGLTADCTDLRIGDFTDGVTHEEFHDLLQQVRPAFGGNIIATIVNPRNWPQMATVREGVMKALPADDSRTGEIVALDTAFLDGFELPAEVVEVVKKAKTVNLKGARVIVAGGAGVGSREGFKLLAELAEALGGTVGGSRAACDLGYVEPERQIGQTGTTVRPALYVAVGISGAVQHIAGMKDSAKILAINTDRDAPIFKIAHYGIVGDYADVVRKLLREIRG